MIFYFGRYAGYITTQNAKNWRPRVVWKLQLKKTSYIQFAIKQQSNARKRGGGAEIKISDYMIS